MHQINIFDENNTVTYNCLDLSSFRSHTVILTYKKDDFCFKLKAILLLITPQIKSIIKHKYTCKNNSKTTKLMCLIHTNYCNRNRILTSSSSALGDLFAFGAEKENNMSTL